MCISLVCSLFQEGCRLPGFCNLCGRRLNKDSALYHHPGWSDQRFLRVCKDCDRSRPRCKRCGIPISSSEPFPLCPTCLQDVPRCLSCGRPITGRYYEINDKGPYCPDCHKHRPVCDTCGAPLGAEQWILSDGRIACGDCHKTAIYEQPAAVQEYDSIKSYVASLLGLSLNIATPVVLVDRNQLAEIARQQKMAEADQIDMVLGVYARVGMRRGIYMQTGLPRTLFVQVAAHEYAHAWQGENCPMLRDSRVREGFAEWVAYKTLVSLGLEKQRARMLQREDIYGEGLRWALQVERRGGALAVMETCRTAGNG